ncbi:hypothetical protein P154DRAFT_579453 [Amniculicola lignicola CBS 123094]|uniref:DUF7892 domain-containing protein n=1 Tax=Amniculicola lignicola CBS 123094 TaxID=1392246 RepID=A0A6A5WGM5_9PLEO|nr:hypothetical protein P154DRAFT_579453 [Amniculicola lignicola CBS 123094]
MEDREMSISSSDLYDSDAKPDSPPREPPSNVQVGKRKAEDVQPPPDKKRRLDSPAPSPPCVLQPCARLPPAAWQHVFSFCSITDLGRLLRVNRPFHSYLTAVSHVPAEKPQSGFLRLLKSESVWAAARHAHPTKPPKPLPGSSELQMWRLALSKRCKFCHKQNSFSPGEKIWQKGPGATGVRAVWPFGVRACGDCLLLKCQTDASLLFSTASALRPALPFAFITTDQNYIPAYTLQAATTPAGVEIVKYYFKDHVQDIMRELEHAQSLGPAAAEEWFKGLEFRGKDRMKASENWERWEVKYQWWSDHQEPKTAVSAPSPLRKTSLSPIPHPLPQQVSPKRPIVAPIVHAPIPTSKYGSFNSTANLSLWPHNVQTSAVPAPALTPVAIPPHYSYTRPATIAPQVFTPQPRGERNLRDANEAKATRKADIERRCQQLNPPILPNILRHMDSFKAAIQISQPMTDDAWSVLQPRLLSQFEAAQQAEKEHVSRLSSFTTRAADRRQHDASLKDVKDVLDREWEELQRPVRDKLSILADDFINQDWDHGRAVTYDNSPKFAVDLLIYVRRRFYAEEKTPAPEADANSPEADQPRQPKLVLENMKWVYDNKLKPITEQFRKELFLCYGAGCETNTRFYGFEGVIQHFGAKHTNTFSVGNVIVAWREAEWPEETPFHPDPISAYQAGQSKFGSYHGTYSRAGTSTPHVQSHLPQASPGPYTGQHGGYYGGPFAPPQAPSNGYDYSNAYHGLKDAYSSYPQPMGPPGYTVGNLNGYMASPAMPSTALVPPPPPVSSNGNADHRTSLFDKEVSTVIQMAQELWKQTSGIKDLPNSLRIYVLLQRVISKFHVEFNHEPNLTHFIDAFSNHQIPKGLKQAPGLSCKACQEELTRQSAGQAPGVDERRTYTVMTLLSHFKSSHCGPSTPGYYTGHPPSTPDWKEDMIELPGDRFISGLIRAPGMDDDKLHIIATVFPLLFPTPLPRIGLVDENGKSTVGPVSKDVGGTTGTPGVPIEKSGPSSLGSPYTDSPRPQKPNEDEYDPQRPALPAQVNQSARILNRRQIYQGSPPIDRQRQYYAEPAHPYVGNKPDVKNLGTNDISSQIPRNSLDAPYADPREYVEIITSPRVRREPGLAYEEYYERRPAYRDHDAYHDHRHEDIAYAHPREGLHPQDYSPYLHPIRYVEPVDGRPEYRLVREPLSREDSPPRVQTEAERFLEELTPSIRAIRQQHPLPQRPPEADPEDGSRYSPPPPNVVGADHSESHQTLAAAPPHIAPSVASNGSRYEEHRPSGRNVPTPDSVTGNPPRRGPPPRRRERNHDYVPSRYYRYMSLAREEPYARGATMHRSQSKRLQRYEDQRRRIDQQETPQPTADRDRDRDRDYDPAYSRDQSVEHGPPDEAYFPPAGRREYIPIQDRPQEYLPTRVRYAGPPDDARGPPPIYVDEYGRPIEDYEYIRVPREARPARGPYNEHVEYVPLGYERPPTVAQRFEGERAAPYVYYEDGVGARRRPVYEEGEKGFEGAEGKGEGKVVGGAET